MKQLVCVTPWGSLEVWIETFYGYAVEFAHVTIISSITDDKDHHVYRFSSLIGPEENGREILGEL